MRVVEGERRGVSGVAPPAGEHCGARSVLEGRRETILQRRSSGRAVQAVVAPDSRRGEGGAPDDGVGGKRQGFARADQMDPWRPDPIGEKGEMPEC